MRGDAFGGTTTGASTTVAGLGSADYWRVKTAPQTGAFAWRHRLTLQSATPGHEISLRGLMQSAGVISAGTDVPIGVSTTSTSPPRFVQWYGFGRQEEVYCRVTGVGATTAPYVVVHECQSVSVLDGGYLREGTITITTNGQGHTTDTDLWVYDSAKNPIAGYGNDDTPSVTTRSTLTRTFAPGTYFLALSRWNLANALASPADDGYRSGDVTDFGDIVLCESSTSPSVLNVSFTDADGPHPMPVTSNEPFEVVWIRFQVSEPVACCLGSSCTLVGPDYCRYSGGYIQGGAPCGATCPPQEVEPNDSKAAAGLLVTGPCDFDSMVLIAGSSTGSSTTTPGATSADYWRVRTPAASVGLYTHTVFLFGSADGYTLELLGLTQTGGVINSGSEAVLLSAVGTSSQYAYVSWNGFGRQGEVILRVTGTPTTTLPYFLGYYCFEVSPPFSSGVFAQGPITITTVGPSQTANTDLWVYDGNWNAIAGFGNDDAAGGTGAQSTLTRTFAPGNYYIALSERNLANSLPSPADDLFRNGSVTDFADVVVGGVDSGGSIAVDVAISDALGGADSIPAQTYAGAGVAWLRFSVAPAGACCVGGTCTTRLLTDCNSNGGYYFGDGAACPAAGCPFVEVEPNESKAAATAVTLDCGQYLGGKSTGTSTTVPGLGSADYFRIQTTVAAPGIYRHRLLYSTSTTAVHSPTLRGLSQFNGVIGASDSTLQFASASTTPPNFCQWYGFGRQESVYYRVAGMSSTTATYLAQLECEPVTPLVGPTLAAGNITIGRSGHTTNTDLWVYDANLLPLSGYGNDEPNTLTRSYAAGTYYLAISNGNFANDLPSSMADETSRNGLVLDFADAVACSSISTNLNLAVLFTDAVGSQTVPATKTTPFEVVFIQFTVVDYGACCATNGSCSVGLAAACTAGGGTFQGSGSTCGPATCPLACLTGDANCDGAINNFDIDAFVQGELDPLNPVAPAVYLAIGGTQACWDQRACWGDVNGDLAFNNFDIDAFVVCIISPPLPGQPCP